MAVMVAGVGGISLEVWDSEGLGEGEGDVGNSVGGPPGSAQVERHFNLGAAFLTA